MKTIATLIVALVTVSAFATEHAKAPVSAAGAPVVTEHTKKEEKKAAPKAEVKVDATKSAPAKDKKAETTKK